MRAALAATADEMAIALQRAAYSTNVKTRQDFSCAVFDRACRMVAQSFSVPIHLGSLTAFVPGILERYGHDRLEPGDAIVCNDGYRSNGVHLNDVTVVAAVYDEGECYAYVAALAHHVDIGGGNPGSMGLTREIFQEGLMIPPTRLVRNGEFDRNVLDLILNNVRSPTESGGDLRAQVAGLNIGSRRLADLTAKYGSEVARSVVNAVDPAPISVGWETGFRVCETAFRALGDAMPDRITAGSKGCLSNIAFGGHDPRTGGYFTFFDSLAGGYGARASKDGIDAIQPHGQNSENAPIEETEANYPVRILRYELIPDSEGAGRNRGGLGLRREYAFEEEAVFTVLADRAKFAPWGFAGGGDARRAHYVRNPATRPEEYPSKFSIRLRPDESFSVEMGGGGGYGDPLQRAPELVLEDVLDEKLSVERARAAYGVVVDAASLDLDLVATDALRAR